MKLASSSRGSNVIQKEWEEKCDANDVEGVHRHT
jgi:hypothetical protein